MARAFSPSFWLNDKPRPRRNTFDDPMERYFIDKFGVDPFTYVHNLYSFSGCQWEVENAYSYLQFQIDKLWHDIKNQRLNQNDWVYVDFNPFEDLTSGVPLRQLAVERAAEGCPLT